MPLEVIGGIEGLRDRLALDRSAGRAIGLVPTMGALHDGHLSLVSRARAECAVVVVSIFVNPLQFDRPEDLSAYPRSIDADLQLCAAGGADIVFVPTPAEMYPVPPDCVVEVGRVADHLCGRTRPGHFRGVATVVMKLFQIAQPGRAYLGEKDAQQLAVIRRLVTDLNVPITIVPVPTVREPDGLALSSRNRGLSADERRVAPVLYEALRDARQRIAAGDSDAAHVRQMAADIVERRQGVTLEYLELVDPDGMQPVGMVDGPVVAAGAIWIGSTRLIDNMLCIPPA